MSKKGGLMRNLSFTNFVNSCSAKFAPGRDSNDKYTARPVSPRSLSPTKRGTAIRSASVSERIAERLKDLKKPSELPQISTNVVTSASETLIRSPELIEKELPKVDKGKVREDEAFTNNTSPKIAAADNPVPLDSVVVLAGIALRIEELGGLISKAKSELPLRPIRFPIIGEYQDCFSGLELVTWLEDNVPTIAGNPDKAELFARDLVERENALRRLGEIGE